MTNKSKILWQEYCQKIGVPVALTEKWFQTIQNKYDTEPQRAFHKSNVLELKSDFILSNAKQINTSVHLTFAIFFQYFHFDVKSDCCEKNCDEFKKFFNEAGLNDVSKNVIICIYIRMSHQAFLRRRWKMLSFFLL